MSETSLVLVNAGMGELLDSGMLDGMLDSGTTCTMPLARSHHRHPRSHKAPLLLLLATVCACLYFTSTCNSLRDTIFNWCSVHSEHLTQCMHTQLPGSVCEHFSTRRKVSWPSGRLYLHQRVIASDSQQDQYQVGSSLCRACKLRLMHICKCECACVCVRPGVMDPAGVVASSSMMDSGVWHEALQHRHPPPFTPCPPSSVMESGATCELPADFDTCALHAVLLNNTFIKYI